MTVEESVSNQRLSIPCPKCGHKTRKTIAWLKENKRFTCTKCESVVAPDLKKLFAGFKQANKLLADMIRRVNKRTKGG